MTDFPDDEVVSAVLDGEATDDEVARVHADAALSARLDELRAARDAIAAPVTLPSHADRDAAIATAMAESASPTVPSIVDLRDRRRRRAFRVASIAAAVLIVVSLAGAIALSSRDDHKATTAAGPQTSVESEDALPAAGGPAAGGPAANRSPTDAPAAAQPSPAPDLGSFQTPADVVDAVRSQKATAVPPPSQPAVPPTTAAADANRTCPTPPDAMLIGRAQLSGQPVVVIVFGTSGQQTVELLDSNCAVVFTGPL